MMPGGHHSDSDSTLLPLPKSAITWFGGIFARLPPLAAGLIGRLGAVLLHVHISLAFDNNYTNMQYMCRWCEIFTFHM